MKRITSRRYEVFVGSTFRELKDARQQIIDAILLAGHIPCGTELWPAEPQAPLGVIADYLHPCDIHVLIIGYRYGSLVPNENKSFTHWEYEQSKRAKRPLLVFLLDKDEAKAERAKLFKDGLDKDSPEHKYDDFRKELEKQENFMLVHFKMENCGIPKLAGDCIAALGRLTTFGLASGQLSPTSGWIRADSYAGESLMAIEGNRFLKRVMDQIRRFEVLAHRVTERVDEKEAMARHFWFYMQSRIRDWAKRQQPQKAGKADMNLFFESGSSLAYVALEFEEAVLNEAGVHEHWHIRTNNILCLLQFELHTALDGRRFPDGKPDPRDKYGAIFPQDWGVLHREPPKKPRKDLSGAEKEAVNKLRRDFCQHGRTFVLAAASGWDTKNDEKGFRGPHVGSHKNMLFKRAIFTSGDPVVLFLDAEKLADPNKAPRKDNCYPVFDLNYLVTKWIQKCPVAICVGWGKPDSGQNLSIANPKNSIGSGKIGENNPADKIRNALKGFGFTKEYFCEEPNDKYSAGAILLANDNFEKEVPLLSL